MTLALCAMALLTPTAHAALPEGKVVCFGDSITYAGFRDKGGAGFKEGERWVERLNAKAAGKTIFVNEGKNGRQTSALNELTAALDRTPDAAGVLIMLGTNDFKNQKDDDATIARCAENVGKLIDVIRQKLPNAQIIIVSPVNMAPAALGDYWKKLGYSDRTDAAVKRLADAYAAVARERKCGFVSLYGAVPTADIPDGIHPNAAGHAAMAEALWKALGE
jgi:lysophospholipase L1-like esterase